MGGDVPPAFGGPSFGILIADGDADPARRRVAGVEIGGSRGGAKTGGEGGGEGKKGRPEGRAGGSVVWILFDKTIRAPSPTAASKGTRAQASSSSATTPRTRSLRPTARWA